MVTGEELMVSAAIRGCQWLLFAAVCMHELNPLPFAIPDQHTCPEGGKSSVH